MSVKVAVRVRPFNQREKDLKCECIVDMENPTTILKPFKGEAEKRFTFDYSLWSFDNFTVEPDGYNKPSNPKYADQKFVNEQIGQKIINNAWEGYHCCLFAYGQTGSGKSYSMIGYGKNKGIVPVTCNEIFERIKVKPADVEYEVYASMLEIYNETIQDLTIPIPARPKEGLEVRENKLVGIYVEGVKKHFVTSYSQIQTVMDEGTKNRTIAATQMNATSSRAHTVITIEFKQKFKGAQGTNEKLSIINLVDLAGSERQDKTGATGQRLKEAVGINLSLTNLGAVISILAENSDPKAKPQHVPYRNSSLTRILENALGGNSQTIMICAISPADDNYDQTISTLRYADRAKKIKNKPVVNESPTDKLIRELKEENQRLKKLLASKDLNGPAAAPGAAAQPKPADVKPADVKPADVKPADAKPGEQKPQDKPKVSEEHKKDEPKKQQPKKEQPPAEIAAAKKEREDLQAQIKKLNEQLSKQKQTREEKEKEAKDIRAEMAKNIGQNQNNIVKEKELKRMVEEGKKIPPYFENISKDITIHRKLKILMDKPKMTIGKNKMEPPNDIVFGGRDIEPRHAELEIVDEKVYVNPLKAKNHLYVNGTLVQTKQMLNHLDRVIFGWNSVYLFKKSDDKINNQKIDGKDIDWYYCKKEVQELVDIDESDDQDDVTPTDLNCCSVM